MSSFCPCQHRPLCTPNDKCNRSIDSPLQVKQLLQYFFNSGTCQTYSCGIMSNFTSIPKINSVFPVYPVFCLYLQPVIMTCP